MSDELRNAGSNRSIQPKDGLAPVIAIVGSDGAGKSTVGEALLAWLRESGPAEMCHLGKQTGDYRRMLTKLPLIGARFGKAARAGAKQVTDSRGPGAFTALATYYISMRRIQRFQRMMKLRRRGVTVIADRYPQLAVLGPKMDGPHLVVDNPENAITRMLTMRERVYYQRMADYLPDLVIRLNVDIATAAARKPDHAYHGLEYKIGLVSKLSFNGAPIVDIDSTQPLAAVLDQAKHAVTAALERRRAA